jgi:hypothetical protein
MALAIPDAAYAQPGAPPAGAQKAERKGFLIGFGVGGGHMSCESTGEEEICDGVTEAGGAHFLIGTMLRPHLGINGEIWVMGHTEDNVTITHAITTVGVTFWLMPRLWVRGGIGGAIAAWRWKGPLGLNLSDETESVPAVMGAVGFELKDDPGFAIDVQLRGGTGFYKDDQAKAHNAAIAVGFTWY